MMKMRKKIKIGIASIHMQVLNLNLFDSILTPCKWPQIEMIFFAFQPREGHLSFNHLGLKMELILHMDNPLSYLSWKTKKIWLCTLDQKPIPRLWSMIEKQRHKKKWPGCYSEPIFLDYFVTFSHHYCCVHYLSKVTTYLTRLNSRD